MANIDLDSTRKRGADPEVIHDIIPKKTKNKTSTPDYGDYEDYELTAKPDLLADLLIESATQSGVQKESNPINLPPTVRVLGVFQQIILDSQYKSHPKLLKQNESRSTPDEISRLMGDLKEEAMSLRTTITKENMTMGTTKKMSDKDMFFEMENIEGSGANEDTTTVGSTTTKQSRIYTTLVQEIKEVGVTARPDPFGDVDYDFGDNTKKTNRRPQLVKKSKKYRKYGLLHGGAVTNKQLKSTVAPLNVNAVPKTKKRLNKTKVDKLKRVKYLNGRKRANNRMRLRKVYSEIVFANRNTTAAPYRIKHPAGRVYVGSTSIVTPQSSSPRPPYPSQPLKHRTTKSHIIDSLTTNNGRTKREADNELMIIPVDEDEVVETVPVINDNQDQKIDMSMNSDTIDDIINQDQQPHSDLYLTENIRGERTQVEPSDVINEDDYSEFMNDNEITTNKPQLRSGLVQITFDGNAVRKQVPNAMKRTQSMKKVDRKQHDNELIVPPGPRKPTMLELLIGDFIERLPPATYPTPQLVDEQWS